VLRGAARCCEVLRTTRASMACKRSEVRWRCQQAASNGTSRSFAWHLHAIETSGVYLRRRAVEAGNAWDWELGAKSSHGRGHRFETCHAHQHKQPPRTTLRRRLPADLPQTTNSGRCSAESVARFGVLADFHACLGRGTRPAQWSGGIRSQDDPVWGEASENPGACVMGRLAMSQYW
jgi:hypothetical protein